MPARHREHEFYCSRDEFYDFIEQFCIENKLRCFYYRPGTDPVLLHYQFPNREWVFGRTPRSDLAYATIFDMFVPEPRTEEYLGTNIPGGEVSVRIANVSACDDDGIAAEASIEMQLSPFYEPEHAHVPEAANALYRKAHKYWTKRAVFPVYWRRSRLQDDGTTKFIPGVVSVYSKKCTIGAQWLFRRGGRFEDRDISRSLTPELPPDWNGVFYDKDPIEAIMEPEAGAAAEAAYQEQVAAAKALPRYDPENPVFNPWPYITSHTPKPLE